MNYLYVRIIVYFVDTPHVLKNFQKIVALFPFRSYKEARAKIKGDFVMKKVTRLLLMVLAVCMTVALLSWNVAATESDEITDIWVKTTYSPAFDFSSFGSLISQQSEMDLGEFARDFDIGTTIMRDGEIWYPTSTALPAGEYVLILEYENPIPGCGNPLNCHLTIEKADAEVLVFPVPCDPIYDDRTYPLVTAGTAEGGKMVYSLTGNNDTFSEQIPTTMDVPGPGVYSVYFKVVGDENHNDVPINFVTVQVGSIVSGNGFTEEEIDMITGDWGVKHIVTCYDGNVYTSWVDYNNTVSALIEDNDVAWLYMEYVDHYDINGNPVYVSGWLGIQNARSIDRMRLFERGSRFYARVAQPYSEEWQVLKNNMDTSMKARLDRDALPLLTFGVTGPDGNEYSDLGDITQLYIQQSTAFPGVSGENITSVNKTLPTDGITTPESGRYTVMLINHLGECLEISDIPTTGSMISNGDSSLMLTICIVSGIALITVAGIALILIVKKAKKQQ